MELIRSVKGGGSFSNSDNLWKLGEERCDIQKYREVTNETKLNGLVQDLKGANRHLIIRAKITGACLSVRGTTVSGTVLFAMEFRYFLWVLQRFSPKHPEPLQRMWHYVWGDTRT